MAISLKGHKTACLAREPTGETRTEAIRKALAERLARGRRKPVDETGRAERLRELGRECDARPDLDTRSADEILRCDVSRIPR